MEYEVWKDRIRVFKTIDVRGIQNDFFLGLKQQAEELPAGACIEVIQNYDPIPLYKVMEKLGFEHLTEQTAKDEYHVYFYRREVPPQEKEIPLHPASTADTAFVDEGRRKGAAESGDLTRNEGKHHLPYEMRLLLSLSDAVGAGRMRQAAGELVKAYLQGLDSAALDEVFEVLKWHRGSEYFRSEIRPSMLFKAYQTIKDMEKQGKERSEICDILKETYGGENADGKDR